MSNSPFFRPPTRRFLVRSPQPRARRTPPTSPARGHCVYIAPSSRVVAPALRAPLVPRNTPPISPSSRPSAAPSPPAPPAAPAAPNRRLRSQDTAATTCSLVVPGGRCSACCCCRVGSARWARELLISCCSHAPLRGRWCRRWGVHTVAPPCWWRRARSPRNGGSLGADNHVREVRVGCGVWTRPVRGCRGSVCAGGRSLQSTYARCCRLNDQDGALGLEAL